MTNSKNTKRALLASVISMMLCVTMLIGSTFAWFTDTAKTAVNKIQSGTLDVALEMKDADGHWVSAEGKTLGWLAADGRPQDEILWEPGCTYNLTDVRIINNGNLALKFKVIINGVDGDSKLLEVIDFTYGALDVKAEGHLLPGEASDAITITSHMDENAGNEYMNLSIEGIGITVIATQDTYEKDSTDENYDKNAEYPVLPTIIDTSVSGTVASASDTVLKDEAAGVTVTIPAGAVEDETDVTLSVKTLGVSSGSVTYEISLTDETGKALALSKEVSVDLSVGKGLTNVKVKHSGEPMDESDYDYNATTGIVTIRTASFSPFEVTYDAVTSEEIVDDPDKAQAEADAKAAEEGYAYRDNNGNYVKLEGNIFNAAIDQSVTLINDVTAGGRPLLPSNSTTVIDLNGKTITGNTTFDFKEPDVPENVVLTMKNGTLDASSYSSNTLSNSTGKELQEVYLNNITVNNSLTKNTIYGVYLKSQLENTFFNIENCILNSHAKFEEAASGTGSLVLSNTSVAGRLYISGVDATITEATIAGDLKIGEHSASGGNIAECNVSDSTIGGNLVISERTTADKAEATITGSTIEGNITTSATFTNWELTLIDTTVVGKLPQAASAYAGRLHIVSGTFGFDPTAYVDETISSVEANDNGTWTVSMNIDEGNEADPFA